MNRRALGGLVHDLHDRENNARVGRCSRIQGRASKKASPKKGVMEAVER